MWVRVSRLVVFQEHMVTGKSPKPKLLNPQTPKGSGFRIEGLGVRAYSLQLSN